MLGMPMITLPSLFVIHYTGTYNTLTTYNYAPFTGGCANQVLATPVVAGYYARLPRLDALILQTHSWRIICRSDISIKGVRGGSSSKGIEESSEESES
ncbi:hypothetical protein SERLA73DRAFT_126297 [Serpula lacrymans var. lacrymans S7.3]|uniref:Uncharacterized protein n=1 Tax=Serpula lacrymans var. lacrymans (strain S7.3) TaxID=936435 RepID=F8QCM6_SERL3|nr:hypothetical protein SERLA73DRAFT_126297 [Serpula lacrymans var. lacrymans S7.3]